MALPLLAERDVRQGNNKPNQDPDRHSDEQVVPVPYSLDLMPGSSVV